MPIKKAAAKPAAKPAAAPMKKMAIVEDDDSEEEDVPIKKAAAKPAAAPMKKMAIVEDDDSEEEDVPIKKAAAKPAAAPMKKMAIVEDDDSEEEDVHNSEKEPPSKVMAEYKASQARDRGTAALKRQEYRTAAEAYHEACKLQPSVHSHFSNLSLALLKFGQPEHAATAARRCTELEPKFVKGFFRLGQALKVKEDYDGAAKALKEALKLHNAEYPNGGKEAGKTAAEIARELGACRDKAKEALAALTEVSAGESGEASSAPKPPSPPKRQVNEAAAVAAGKRAAEIASKAPVGSKAPVATLSQFEREYKHVWAKGKGSSQPEALRTLLAALPAGSAGEMGAFVNENLTEDLLSGVILGTAAAGEPAGTAAARIAHLSTCKRFEMAWMFVGAAEKSAVTAILTGGVGCAELPADELAAAAKRYGVKL